MESKPVSIFVSKFRVASALSVLCITVLSACTPVTSDSVTRDGVFDPYEQGNRARHKFNKSLDKAILRPVGIGYTKVMPDDVEIMVGNFGSNLSEPSNLVNHALQGDLKGFGVNLYRFVVNSTLGFGGLFDVAGSVGVAEDDTNFGETLHTWGANEGAYIELPVLGPSTERDAVGKVVDLFTNPLSGVLEKPEKYAGPTAKAADAIGSRGRFTDTVDSVLYESADSYAQLRLLHLQNRRFELGASGEDDYLDPYSDPYSDPYEDPYEN
ncbi:MAG: VacJ family lipoprotein [Thalassovita sp.]